MPAHALAKPSSNQAIAKLARVRFCCTHLAQVIARHRRLVALTFPPLQVKLQRRFVRCVSDVCCSARHSTVIAVYESLCSLALGKIVRRVSFLLSCFPKHKARQNTMKVVFLTLLTCFKTLHKHTTTRHTRTRRQQKHSDIYIVRPTTKPATRHES